MANHQQISAAIAGVAQQMKAQGFPPEQINAVVQRLRQPMPGGAGGAQQLQGQGPRVGQLPRGASQQPTNSPLNSPIQMPPGPNTMSQKWGPSPIGPNEPRGGTPHPITQGIQNLTGGGPGFSPAVKMPPSVMGPQQPNPLAGATSNPPGGQNQNPMAGTFLNPSGRAIQRGGQMQPQQQPQQAQPQQGGFGQALEQGPPRPVPGLGGPPGGEMPMGPLPPAQGGGGGDKSEFWKTVMQAGLATMAAADRPGASTLGALGQGGLAAMQGHERRSLRKDIQKRKDETIAHIKTDSKGIVWGITGNGKKVDLGITDTVTNTEAKDMEAARKIATTKTTGPDGFTTVTVFNVDWYNQLITARGSPHLVIRQGAGQSGGLKTVKNAADYAKLAAGEDYLDPDGVKRTKK